MKKGTKKLAYGILAAFLLAMAVMTVVSRVINESHIPVVDTYTPRRGTLEVEAIGRGVVRFGEASIEGMELWDGEAYYVEGYFFEKDYVANAPAGSKVLLSIGGRQLEGTLAAKTYNYREDTTDVLVLLPEGEAYLVGDAVEFALGEAKMRYSCCIPRELVYEEEDGGAYVYLLKERDSIAGNITVAVKMPIHIIAANPGAVAVSDEFGSDTKVITKEIALEDGMRVRERE